MKKLISFVVLFAAFLAAPSSLADDSPKASAAATLRLGPGAVSSVNKASIKCGEVAIAPKDSFSFGVAKASAPVDRVRSNFSGSAKVQ